MAIAFYMDEHIPEAITSGLRMQDVDVLTVQEDGFINAPDSDILDRANELGRILVTYDEDFLHEVSIKLTKGIPVYGLIFVQNPKRLSIRKCIDDLVLIAKVLDPEEFREQKIVHLPFGI